MFSIGTAEDSACNIPSLESTPTLNEDKDPATLLSASAALARTTAEGSEKAPARGGTASQGTGGTRPSGFVIVAQGEGQTVEGRRIPEFSQGLGRLPAHLRVRRPKGVQQKGNDLLDRLDPQYPGRVPAGGFGTVGQGRDEVVIVPPPAPCASTQVDSNWKSTTTAGRRGPPCLLTAAS